MGVTSPLKSTLRARPLKGGGRARGRSPLNFGMFLDFCFRLLYNTRLLILANYAHPFRDARPTAPPHPSALLVWILDSLLPPSNFWNIVAHKDQELI